MAISPARAARFLRDAQLDFDQVPDPRHARGKQLGLTGMLRLMVVALACRQNTLRDIEEVAEDLGLKLLKKLGLHKGPSDTALYELLSVLPWAPFRDVLRSQVRDALDRKVITNDLLPWGVVTFDGKGAGGGMGPPPTPECRTTVCDTEGTACWNLFTSRACLTSASVHPLLDVEFIKDEGETTIFARFFERVCQAYPRLFDVVTIDAGYTSRANAEIVRLANKHYVAALKGSFSRLFPLAQEALRGKPALAQTIEREGGARVVRELRRSAIPEGFDFFGATELWQVTQTITRSDATTAVDERVFVVSLPPDEVEDAIALRLVRCHWGIENNANWTLDLVFGEDESCPCRAGSGLTAFMWLRILAYNLLAGFRAHLPQKDRLPRSWRDAARKALIVLVGAQGFDIQECRATL